MFEGGLGAGLQDLVALAEAGGSGGRGAGGAYSYSRRTTRTVVVPGGAPGGGERRVEFLQTSRGAQPPGEELVTETHRSLTDSATGFRRVGVARTVGAKGRSFHAEQDGRGHERRADALLHGGGSGADFDREWLASSARARLNDVPILGGGGGPRGLAGSAEERAAARRGRQAFEEQTRRVFEEAERLRPPGRRRPGGRGLAPPPPVSPPASLPPSRGGRGSAGPGTGPRPDTNERLARSFASDEAQRFWG